MATTDYWYFEIRLTPPGHKGPLFQVDAGIEPGNQPLTALPVDRFRAYLEQFMNAANLALTDPAFRERWNLGRLPRKN